MCRLILTWSLFPKLAPASLSASSWLFSTVPSSFSLTLPRSLHSLSLSQTQESVLAVLSAWNGLPQGFPDMFSLIRGASLAVSSLDPSSPSLPVRLLVSSAALVTLGTHIHCYLFPFLCLLTSTRIPDVQEQGPSTSCPQLSFQCQCLAH